MLRHGTTQQGSIAEGRNNRISIKSKKRRKFSETGQQKRNTLGTLSAVNQRIVQQEAPILSVQSEIELMDMDISENNEILRSLQTDLIRPKEEYAAMVFAAQKDQRRRFKIDVSFFSGNI